MSLNLKTICLFLVVVLTFSLIGCNKGNSSTISSSSDTGVSSEDISSDLSSSESDLDFEYEMGAGKVDPSADDNNQDNLGYEDYFNTKDPFGTGDSTDSTQNKDPNRDNVVVVNKSWSGPNGYVIVVPANNSAAKTSAETLQKFFKQANGVTLQIVTDETTPSKKEILIGKTNRSESNKSLADSKLKVSVVGEKLVFDGGHDVTVDMAVQNFLLRSPGSREVSTFEETTDFSSTKNGIYKYVWGDEFYGTSLNKNLWSDKSTKMTGAGVIEVESTPQTISVNNGALKLTAYKDEKGNYHVPTSVHTQSTMNFRYGYVEMRAKLSLELGSFASFWTRSISDKPNAAVAPSMRLDHFFEVDMFEVFQREGDQRIGGNILINSDTKSKNWYPTAMPHTQQLIIPDEEYHLFGYEWTPTEIKLYFDNKMYARFDMSKPWTGKTTSGKGIDGWKQQLREDKTGTNLISFQEHQYLIFNHHLHIEVEYIDENGDVKTKGFLASDSVTKNTNFKNADYLIDYVRVYQQNKDIYTK